MSKLISLMPLIVCIIILLTLVFTSFPQALLSGGPSMTVPMIPLDDGRLSDDEASHKHKGGLNSKLSAEAK